MTALQRFLVCLVVALSGRLDAQPETTPPASPSNRYLLIVDTSKSMETRERGMLKVVQELLASGMGGQMKAGDTLGVWTYNTDLYAGRFPLQRWSPETQTAISASLVKFLKGEKFENEAALGRVLTAMGEVVKDSRLITVILVSAGGGIMQGTPFDDRINEFFQRWQDKQKSAKMPYVIVLRARTGEFVDYTLNLPPWPVQMPYLPTETQVAAAPALNTAPATPPQDLIPATPPLTVSRKETKRLDAPKVEEATLSKPAPTAPAGEPGMQRDPAPPPTKADPVESPKAETPTVKVETPAAAPAATTNAPLAVKVDVPKPEPPAKETAKAEPAPAPPPTPAPEPPPAQVPSAVPPATIPSAEAPKAETAKAPAEKPAAEAAVPAPAPAPPPPPKADAAKAAASNPPPAAPVQVAAAPSLHAQSNASPAAVEPSKTAPVPQPKPDAVSAPVPHPPVPVAAVTNIQVKSVTPSSPLPAAPVAVPTNREVAAAPAKVIAPLAKKAEPVAVPAPAKPQVMPASNRMAVTQDRPQVGAPRASEVASARQAAVTNTTAALAAIVSNPPAPRPLPITPAQTAVVAPAKNFLSQKTTWVAGVLLLGVALGFGWLALRRSRATPHASLITRSLDREKRK